MKALFSPIVLGKRASIKFEARNRTELKYRSEFSKEVYSSTILLEARLPKRLNKANALNYYSQKKIKTKIQFSKRNAFEARLSNDFARTKR